MCNGSRVSKSRIAFALHKVGLIVSAVVQLLFGIIGEFAIDLWNGLYGRLR